MAGAGGSRLKWRHQRFLSTLVSAAETSLTGVDSLHLIVARSGILWGEGDQVHGFNQVSGALMIVVGAVIAITG